MENDEIGAFAGRVWEALSKKDSLTVEELERETKIDELFLKMAIGWLARENQIYIHEEPDKLTICLNLPPSLIFF